MTAPTDLIERLEGASVSPAQGRLLARALSNADRRVWPGQAGASAACALVRANMLRPLGAGKYELTNAAIATLRASEQSK